MSGKPSLLENSSDSEVELTINKDYANRYDHWRNKEELQKYKDLKKDEEDSESSSESEEESIEEIDDEFFRALSLLKGKDLKIHDKNFHLFQEKEKVKKTKDIKPKPIYMKDYERNLVLERGGKFSDEDDEENLPEKVPTYNEEQENLKKSFQEAVGGSDDSDYDDLLQVRTKTKKEDDDAEADYVKWVKGEEKDLPENVKKDMHYLRNYWNDPKLNKDEKFLSDYILNKKYLEKDDSEIPTYEELTSHMPSDDENVFEKFEHKYDFRFEEPDEEFIKRYPRTIGDSLRRVDNRRKQKREEVAERKKKEREQRREELKRLKALKRKEIEEKFMKLKEISGQDEINLNESDIESDFDPDKHDKKMSEMFNDEYYQVEEDKKPEFPYDDELDSENWNAWTGEKSLESEDQEVETACDEEESNEIKPSAKDDFANEMINASCPKKKVKKKSIFAKIISQPKPIYDPSGKSFEDYLDEYYKLDYEDVIGDLPVRYKYRKVIPNDFGLTVDEILAADDRELNRWCSVKKTCQYRNDDEELYDVQAFKKKAGNPVTKIKLLPSVYAPKDNDNSVDSNVKEKKALSGNASTTDRPCNKIDDQEDLGHEMSEKTQTANGNFGSSMQINVSSKKSKKKKRKFNTSLSENETELTVLNQSNVCDLNISNLDDREIGRDCLQSQEESKKSKKKKWKEKVVISDTKNKYENSNDILVRDSDTFVTESCTSIDDSKQPIERKRKHIENSLSDSKVDQEGTSDDSSPKSIKKRTSDITIATESNSNLSENFSEAPLKKKKKKKKKQKGNASNYNETTMQGNISNPSHNKFKGKYKKHASEDKRLGLSDERLAAYGINPKKFKNRIIYSKK